MKTITRNGEVLEHSGEPFEERMETATKLILWPLLIVSVVMGLAVGTGVVYGIVKVANYWMK